ncbi:uncharacterized protein PAC_08525 [Phialocephala subalpina]|uniref:Uncharacterized protein n=1 Tax=Phialocephala subalpina TaxID=576137 RepID=A0A1L7X0T4_9HELO|nr:uncharacterized protein PAC_08525 [Phialocephala subalpina]
MPDKADKKSRIPSIRPTHDDDEPSSSSRSSRTKTTGSFRPPQSSAPWGSSRPPPASSAPKKPSMLSKVTPAYPRSSRPSKVVEDDDDEPPPGSDSDYEEEEDDVDEPPVRTKTKTGLPTNLTRDNKSMSAKPTDLMRDRKSRAPSTTATKLTGRDMKSRAPSTKATQLTGRDMKSSSTSEVTRANTMKNAGSHYTRPDSRREGQASIKPKTVGFASASNIPSLISTDARTIEADEKIMNSVRSTLHSMKQTDNLKSLATAHSEREKMTDKQKSVHDKGVAKTLSKIGPCPEKNPYNRVDGGYVCSEGGHAVTDEMVKEGLGAIAAFENGESYMWNRMRGPYYITGDGFVYNRNRKFKYCIAPIKNGGPKVGED